MEQESQLARFGLFDARVPRDTSCTSVTRFGPQVDAGVFYTWRRAIAPGASISLYVQVPFCRRLCWFCACRTRGTATTQPVRAHVRTLLAPGLRLARLHRGGGTPKLPPPDVIRASRRPSGANGAVT